MAETRFLFCGLDSYIDLGVIVADVHRYIAPAITENTQVVPGMYGAVFQGLSYGERQFDIDIIIPADTETERLAVINRLAEVMIQTQVDELPIVFTDDPDWTYYGHFTSLPSPARVANGDSSATATLTFMCSDPQGYAKQVSQPLTGGIASLTAAGNGSTRPIITCLPKGDLTKIAVADTRGNYVYIGTDVTPDSGEPTNPYPVIVNDECNTFETGWTTVPENPTWNFTSSVINTDADMQAWSGQFAMDDYKDFGTVRDGKYYGAAKQFYFPSSYSDYRVRARMFFMQSYPRAKSNIVLLLLNADGKRIGRMGLADWTTGEDTVVQIGISKPDGAENLIFNQRGSVKQGSTKMITLRTQTGTKTVTVKGKKKTETVYKNFSVAEQNATDTYTNFGGWLQLEKRGNKFIASVMKLDDNGKNEWLTPFSIVLTDTAGDFTEKLAGVALYIGKYAIEEDKTNPVKVYENNHMGLLQLQAWEVKNNGGSVNGEPVVLATAGDEIKIDCEEGRVYKNGMPFMQYVSADSRFIGLQGGVVNTLALDPEPGDHADWYIDYRPTRK